MEPQFTDTWGQMPLDFCLQTLNDPLDPREPRQTRLYRLLKEAILAGQLAPGTRLPGSRQLASDYRMARNCVLFAYQQLLAEGFLEADRGGTRVGALPLTAATAVQATTPLRVPSLSQRARQLPPTPRGESFLPFAAGVPDLNAFPWPAWARMLQRAWREVSARQVAYAEPGGEPELRQAVATFLSARRSVVCTPAQVFIFPGGQIALDACARLLADSGDTVWLEEPCYTAARNAMLAAGLKTVPVPVDHDGMAADAALWRTSPPKLIYVTPSHQYPLGSVLSLERRLDLLNKIGSGAETRWLIEDDYDSDFNHARPGTPLPAIQGLRPDAPVIYVGTFSKLLYPGLRIAYMVVPRWAVADIGEAIHNLYRSGQAVEQRALARFLDSGQLTRHVRRMAPIYRDRQHVLRTELSTHFGADCEILGGQAGLHLVLRLPEDLPDKPLADAAQQRGVVVRALSSYYTGSRGGNGLVLGYGMAETRQIPELVRRLSIRSE